MPRPRKTQKKQKKKQYFRTLLESPQMPRPRKKHKNQKKTKKNNISELFLKTPQSPRPLENCFFCFFCFFGFLQVFVKSLEILFFFFFFFFLVFCRVFGFLPEGLSQDLQNIAFFISIWFSAGLFQLSFSRCPLLVLWRAFGSIELAEYVWANMFKKCVFT